MWNFQDFYPRCFCHLLVVICCVARFGTSEEITNFIAVNTLADGEIETRIYYKGVTAKEITVGRRSLSDIRFRQLVDKNHFIQLIYSDGDLKDCEILHQKKQIKKFLHTFKHNLSNLISTSNVTIESLDDRPFPIDTFLWFNYSQLSNNCKKLQHKMKSELSKKNSHLDKRPKRDLSELLRIPGTKWCGKGYSADKYTRLGGFSRTDKCCRRHDLSCPFWIGGFETKYGLFNWRINTIMHCSCDERFRACLKLVDTSDSNLVGKLFFNVVQSKCFVIKPKKICVKSSWWGQCEKFKHIKQAIIRDNLPY